MLLALPQHLHRRAHGPDHSAADDALRQLDSSTNLITTYAGTGTAGFSGDNGAANLARLSLPTGLALDSADNLYIADMNNNRLRKVDTSGVITTIAGNGTTSFADGQLATATIMAVHSTARCLSVQGRSCGSSSVGGHLAE